MRPDLKLLNSKRSLATVLVLGIFALMFSGCSKIYVSQRYMTPGFSMETVKTSKSLLTVSNMVEIVEFKKSFEWSFGTPDSLSHYLSRMISDSLKSQLPGMALTSGSSDFSNALEANALDRDAVTRAQDLFKSTDAKYIVNVKNLVLGNSVQDNGPAMMSTGGGGGGTMMVGGGSSETCIFSFEVEFWDSSTLSKKAAYRVSGKGEVFMFAYQTALQTAVDNCIAHFIAYVKEGRTEFY